MNSKPLIAVAYVVFLLIGPICQASATENTAMVDEVRGPQYFALYVQDVDKSVAWYCTMFGLEKLVGSAAEDGAWRIENVGNDRLLVEIIYDRRAQEADRTIGLRKVGFAVADVDEVAARIEAATGESIEIVEFAELNQRILQLKDPDGITVQLFSPIE